ncbi:MAG: FtsX-like permease family protein [Oscillospiraceae bacterium]|nr:FtsX-like permease family protein [Oscillospiraceae bacterium]
MVTTLFKSTLREIRQSLGRYLAIFAIIALGVGFFAGLRMSQPSMLATGVEYIDRHNLFDFRLLSTLGFTQEDVESFVHVDGVETARGAVYTDFLARWSDEEEQVFTALSLMDGINEPQITAGWMPKNENECLGDARYFSEEDLGKIITVSHTNDEDTLELLRCDSYMLVGLMQTPYYLNQDRGTSSIGGGSVDAYIYIPESGFDFEAYYEIFLKLTDGEQSYSDAYQDQMDRIKPSVESLTEERAQLRFDTLHGDAMEELLDAEAELSDGWDEYNREKADADRELADAYQELSDGEQEYTDGLSELEQGKIDYLDGKKQYEDGLRELADAKVELDQAKNELENAKKELHTAKTELDTGEVGYKNLNTLYQSAVQMAQQTQTGTAQQLMELLRGGVSPELNASVDQALQAQGSSLTEFLAGWTSAEETIGQKLTEEYLRGVRTSLDAGQAEYEAGLAAYETGFAQYEIGRMEYEDGLREMDKAKRELADAERELSDAEQTLKDARVELDDGWAEYEDGKAEAEREFADAYEELMDAQEEIAQAYEDLGELKEADIYVLTRQENAGYVSFDNDTSIIAAVSVVFPVFFFLVAALVCVTTMTRMVDEQRTQIGVLKALGYSNRQIMGKYIFYSGSATVVGCTIGYAVGSTVLPWVIWEIYGIMYDFASLKFLFDPVLAILSFAAALLCSVGSTYWACRAELRQAAAELIRPKAPKAGRRVILEYITPLWRRLSFLHKVSVRNVLRYHSRLIMMVVGIGGCTALLLTGFGLRDSVLSVMDEQFEKITFYDYVVTFQEAQTEESVAQYLTDKGWDEGLLVHSGSTDLVTDHGTKSVPLIISKENSLDRYVSLHTGEVQIPYPGVDEAVLDRGLAEKLQIAVGDEVRLRNDDGETILVAVSGICDNYVGNYIYLSAETYERQLGEKPEFQTLYLHAHSGADPYAEGAQLSDTERVSRVTVNEANRTQVQQMMGRLDYLVVIVVVCAGALAFIVLYNLTNINITERIREIATIKVLGFYKNETAAYVYREIYILSALGSVAGIFMGRALHLFVMAQVQVDAVYFPALIHPVSYLWSVGLTLLFTVLIALVMRPRLNRIDMAESLKSVE